MDDNFSLVKSAVQRSHAYPSFTIQDSVELVKKIYTQLGVSSYQTRETIAKVLNLSPDTLNKKLSTSVQYNLLDLKAREGYKATPLFIKLYKPLNEEERKEALLQALRSPKLYAALLEEYNNNIVPSVVGVSTNLYRNHNISDSASEKAAQVFIDNLKELNLLDQDNHLVLNDETEPIEEVEQDNRKPHMLTRAGTLGIETQKFYGGGGVFSQIHPDKDHLNGIPYEEELPLVISLKDGKKAKLIYPEGISNEDWDKIIRVIQAMKE